MKVEVLFENERKLNVKLFYEFLVVLDKLYFFYLKIFFESFSNVI